MTGIVVAMRFGEAFGGLLPGPQGIVLAALLRTGAPLTGRQVHALVSDDASLWSVQRALASLVAMGLVESRPVGRALVHTINEEHYAIRPLRELLDPLAKLRSVVTQSVGSDVQAVVLFGSVARGEATPESDIDLAVIAPPEWPDRARLEDAVHQRMGNTCDVLVFTADEFAALAANGTEPVVADIVADGIPLTGALPRSRDAAS